VATTTPAWATLAVAGAALVGVIYTGWMSHKTNQRLRHTSVFINDHHEMVEWHVHKRALVGPYIAAGRAVSRAKSDQGPEYDAFLGAHAAIMVDAREKVRNYLTNDLQLPKQAVDVFGSTDRVIEIIKALRRDAGSPGGTD
jgi:hypothetical protein